MLSKTRGARPTLVQLIKVFEEPAQELVDLSSLAAGWQVLSEYPDILSFITLLKKLRYFLWTYANNEPVENE